MSKIHAHINDTETPEAVRNLMQEFVKDFESRSSDVWIREVKNRDSEHHRKTLLKQGRCDFDKPTHGLTSEELICLYNYYYFPMHFQSSFTLYLSLFEKELYKLLNYNKVCFLDYGCGTLSSSIGFSSAIKKMSSNIFAYIDRPDEYVDGIFYTKSKSSHKFSYLYADISTKLLDYNDKIIFFDGGCSEEYYQTKIVLWNCNLSSCKDWSEFYPMEVGYYIEEVVDNFYRVELSNKIDGSTIVGYRGKLSYFNLENDIYQKLNDALWQLDQFETIIVNFSYIFASESLNIVAISNVLIKLIIQYNPNIVIVNQNPDRDDLNTKWEEFKEKVPLKSIAKGVAPIKHYGNSKVRYEVLFKSKFDDVFSNVEIFIKKQQPI